MKIHYTIGDLVINFDSLCGIELELEQLTWDEQAVTCKRCLKILKAYRIIKKGCCGVEE